MAFGGRSQLKMSEETFDFVCSACARSNKTVEAVKYCVECIGYCCQPCTDTHKNFPALSGHNISDITQASTASGQKSILTEFPTERCSIHQSKVLDMYCEHHDTVGCYVCFAKDHPSCQDHIHSIPDMIDTIFKLSDSKQTHHHLKDMIVSMKALSKSREFELEALKKAKKEVLEKVTMFHKALEALLIKSTESSRNKVEDAYKELEKAILQDKHTVDDTYDHLQTTDDKLNQSEGNKAQTFVCTKLAQTMIKTAEIEKNKQEIQHNGDRQISFLPDQLLMKYVKSLQDIGKVKKCGPQKNDLYKLKQIRDITIRQTDDRKACFSRGCCLTHDDQLLVTDEAHKKLKRIDIQKMSVVDYCTLDSSPRGVCCISKHEVAVACTSVNKIQFLSTQGKMSPTRQIKMSHMCFGIAFNDGKLYVTTNRKSVYAYDMTGTLLKEISQDNDGNCLFRNNRHVTFNESGNVMLVGGWDNGLVCFDNLGNYVSTVKDSDLNRADGVSFDGRGNMFVVGYSSHNVVQFSENGEKVGVVVKLADGLQRPLSMCFHQGLNKMFVTMSHSNVVKMYELE